MAPLVTLLASVLASLAVESESLTKMTKRFIEKDAAYLIDDRERAEFGALLTELERRAFAEAFWRRRDPLPETPKNEFRAQHLRRIEAADRRFLDEGIPGWKTDRGRCFILYGPPDEIERHDSDSVEMESLRSGFQASSRGRSYYANLDPMSPGALATEGREVWYYLRPTGGLRDFGGRLVFIKNARGRWVLSSGSEASPAALLYRAPAAADLSRPDVREPGGTPLDPNEVERQALDEMVLAGHYRAAIPTAVSTYYLPSVPGSSLVAVAVRIEPQALSFYLGGDRRRATLRLFGAVLKGFGSKAELVRSLSIPVEIEEHERSHTLVFSLELPPGRFQLHLGVIDTASFKVGSLAQTLSVPDFDAAPRLSSILLARRYRTKAPAVVLSVETGELDLGTFALALATPPHFRGSESVEVFYQVAGLSGPFEIRYQLWQEGTLGPSFTRRAGTRNVIQPLPLSALNLAPGRYRLRVRVKDERTGATLEGEAPLVIDPGSPQPNASGTALSPSRRGWGPRRNQGTTPRRSSRSRDR